MDFARSGMLGVTVLCIALAGALFGGYLAGVDTIEEPAVDYEYLADVSGLFDYDRSPNYIEFDSSTNYTGYYSRGTGDYFPESRVDFTDYVGVNNYRISRAPIESISDMVTLPNSSPSDIRIISVSVGNADHSYNSYQSEAIALSDLIPLITDQTTGKLTIRSQEPLSTWPGESVQGGYSLDWILIASESDLNSHRYYGMLPDYYREYVVQNPSTVYHPIALSCIVDLDLGNVTIFEDNDTKSMAGTISIGECIIIYGGNLSPGLVPRSSMTLSYDADYTYELQAPPKYLDPTRGVTLRGA